MKEYPKEELKQELPQAQPAINQSIDQFYELIIEEEVSAEEILVLLSQPKFKLFKNEQGKEKLIPESMFQEYHPHSFETPLLAICHIAAEHTFDISDLDLVLILKLLITLGANIHAHDDSGNTAILLLAASGREREPLVESIAYLLDMGAELNAKNVSQETVLTRSLLQLNFALAEELYNMGAEVSVNSRNETYLAELYALNEEDLLEHADELIRHLKMHHLLSDFKDTEKVYPAPVMDNVAHLVQALNNDCALTESSLKMILKKCVDNSELLYPLALNLDRKLKLIYRFKFEPLNYTSSFFEKGKNKDSEHTNDASDTFKTGNKRKIID